jgi:aerobic-type carbon monoxide dehydrogenase small subunit (CoxS/CutS family)
MSLVKLQVNGTTHEVDVDPSTPLLYVLRNDLDLRGPSLRLRYWASAARVPC